MFIKLDKYFEEIFKVCLYAENARARIESLRRARATRTRAIFTRTRNIFLASRARNARARDRPSASMSLLENQNIF